MNGTGPLPETEKLPVPKPPLGGRTNPVRMGVEAWKKPVPVVKLALPGVARKISKKLGSAVPVRNPGVEMTEKLTVFPTVDEIASRKPATTVNALPEPLKSPPGPAPANWFVALEALLSCDW